MPTRRTWEHGRRIQNEINYFKYGHHRKVPRNLQLVIPGKSVYFVVDILTEICFSKLWKVGYNVFIGIRLSRKIMELSRR